MSFWVAGTIAAGTVLNIGGRMASGSAAANVDTDAQEQAAMGVAKEERLLASRGFTNAIAGLEHKYDMGMETSSLKAGKSLFELSGQVAGAYKKSGMATVGQIEQKREYGEKSVFDIFKLQKKDYSAQLEMGTERADIAKQKQLGAIEQRLQQRLDQVASTPDSYWEGFWGQSDYQIG